MTPFRRAVPRAACDRWLRVVIGRCDGRRSTVKVARYLAGLGRRFDKVAPSRAGIAAATGLCERTVSRAVGELEAARLVHVLRDRPRCRDGRWGRNRTNLYGLKWPPKGTNAQVRPKGHAMHVNAVPETVEPRGGARSAAPTPPDPVPIPLFVEDPPDPPSDPVVPPPWITEGISRDEWIRRQQA